MLWLWIMIAAVIVMIAAVVLVAANKIFDVAVNAKKTKEKVLKTNANTAEKKNEKTKKEIDNEWLREQAFRIREQMSWDGLRLVARELPAKSPSDIWVVCIHGFSGCGLNLGIAARRWHEKGYHVFLPDLRGSGDSEGDYYGMGWLDRLDIVSWLRDAILAEHPDAKIILHGVSMGAATVMMTTGETLPKNVRAAVEDCGYTSVWEEFTIQLKKVFGLPQFPIMHIANGMAKRRAGYSFKEASSMAQVKKSKTPTLFIHGDQDTFVPFSMLDEVYQAAACEKKKLVVRGAQHGEAVCVEPENYWATIDEFTAKHLGDS